MSKNHTDQTSGSGGIGIVGALGLIFITLKLTDNIDWSWWWVLSPFWISTLIFIGVVAIVLLVAVIGIGLKVRKNRKGRK